MRTPCPRRLISEGWSRQKAVQELRWLTNVEFQQAPAANPGIHAGLGAADGEQVEGVAYVCI